MNSKGVAYPPIADLLPHAAPMIFIDRIIASEGDEVTCAVIPGTHQEPLSDGKVPTWAGLEYMAQTIGIYAGLKEYAANLPVRLGYFIGTRDMQVAVPYFEPHQELTVRVRPYWLQGEISVFDCEICNGINGDVCMQGKLNVYQPARESQVQDG